jgi:GNAT superfamily N-acetyltransferase
MSSTRLDIEVRRAEDHELDEVVAVCGSSLEWDPSEPNAAFFAWKHRDNPFGASPIWVAVEDGHIVGVRTMMRWALRRGSTTRSMVRAVDTATLPGHQGRGIFSQLTRRAVDDLTAEGVDGVFNTPNDKSRPGYLKMGWHELGRLPVGVRPRTPAALVAMARSRVAADKWGIPCTTGLHPTDALADTAAVSHLIDRSSASPGWSTPLSVAYLRWRTGFGPLHCRILPLGDSVSDGIISFRLRRRGALVQLSVLDVIVPDTDGASRRATSAIGHLLRRTGADVAMVTGPAVGLRRRVVPMPGTGPIVTWRPLATSAVPPLDELALPLGAVELF